jgi:hypothetical protein
MLPLRAERFLSPPCEGGAGGVGTQAPEIGLPFLGGTER